MTMPGCQTCSASPGLGSHCMAGLCPDIQPRTAARLTASLRKLKALKTHADAALALAEKMLAAAKTDQAIARAEERKQKAAAEVADFQTQLDPAEGSAKSKLDAAVAAQDAAT